MLRAPNAYRTASNIVITVNLTNVQHSNVSAVIPSHVNIIIRLNTKIME